MTLQRGMLAGGNVTHMQKINRIIIFVRLIALMDIVLRRYARNVKNAPPQVHKIQFCIEIRVYKIRSDRAG